MVKRHEIQILEKKRKENVIQIIQPSHQVDNPTKQEINHIIPT